ncbi:hypothetical protein [Mycoplasma procyoni]|uniref:hypothetical protein n=1 Tax=Mycoplasma procyoni TaxID=568784 RepID=UPI00197B9D3A|nr:hypothetical protein [Mycoplasma procyoni]MBN3534774.1 hypothetical protein [Mycoplasma procyoni]
MNKKKFKKLLILSSSVIAPITPFLFMSAYDSQNPKESSDIFKEEFETKLLNSIDQEIKNATIEIGSAYPTEQQNSRIRYLNSIKTEIESIKDRVFKVVENNLSTLETESYYLNSEQRSLKNTIPQEQKARILNTILNNLSQNFVLDQTNKTELNWLNNPQNFPIYGRDYNIQDKESTEQEKAKIKEITDDLIKKSTTDSQNRQIVIVEISKFLLNQRQEDQQRIQKLLERNAAGEIVLKGNFSNAFDLKNSDFTVSNPLESVEYGNIELESTQENGKVIVMKVQAQLRNVPFVLKKTFSFEQDFKQYTNNKLQTFSNYINQNKLIQLSSLLRLKNSSFESDDFEIKYLNNNIIFSVNEISESQQKLDLKYSIYWDINNLSTANNRYEEGFVLSDFSNFETVELSSNYDFYSYVLQNPKNIENAPLLDPQFIYLKDAPKDFYYNISSSIAQKPYFIFNPKESGYVYNIESIKKASNNPNNNDAIITISVTNGSESKTYTKTVANFAFDSDTNSQESKLNISEEEKNDIYNSVAKNQIDSYKKIIDSLDYSKLNEKDQALLALGGLLINQDSAQILLDKTIEDITKNKDLSSLSEDDIKKEIADEYSKKIKELFSNQNVAQESVDLIIKKSIENAIEKFKENPNANPEELNKRIEELKKFQEKLNNEFDQLDFKTYGDLVALGDNLDKIINTVNSIQGTPLEDLLLNSNHRDIKRIQSQTERGLSWTLSVLGFTISALALISILVIFAKKSLPFRSKLGLLGTSGSIAIASLIAAVYILINLIN